VLLFVELLAKEALHPASGVPSGLVAAQRAFQARRPLLSPHFQKVRDERKINWVFIGCFFESSRGALGRIPIITTGIAIAAGAVTTHGSGRWHDARESGWKKEEWNGRNEWLHRDLSKM
jgi:hypothetical protein